MKYCSKCKKDIKLNNFHKDKTSKDGLYRWCKDCKKEYDISYRKSDKMQSYYSSEEYKNSKVEYVNKNYLKHKLSTLKSKIKYSGRNLEFNIEETHLDVVEYCPLLNIKLDYKITKGVFNWNAASIDRIDNTKGYIPGNVWIVSRLANSMKGMATKEELITFSENIIKKFKNKDE